MLTVIGLKEGMGALVGGLIGDKEGQSTARLAREVEGVRLVALEAVQLHGKDPHGDLDTVFRQEARAWLQANSPTAAFQEGSITPLEKDETGQAGMFRVWFVLTYGTTKAETMFCATADGQRLEPPC